MGVYDTLNIDGAEGAQVKCWGSNMIQLTLGDKIPDIQEGVRDYGVALHEGGYVLILNSRINGWLPEPPVALPTFDKYGDAFDPDLMLGEGYFFKESES